MHCNSNRQSAMLHHHLMVPCLLRPRPTPAFIPRVPAYHFFSPSVIIGSGYFHFLSITIPSASSNPVSPLIQLFLFLFLFLVIFRMDLSIPLRAVLNFFLSFHLVCRPVIGTSRQHTCSTASFSIPFSSLE